MTALLEILFHPSRWKNIDDLALDQRIAIALAVLLLTAAVAVVSALLSSRWVRSHDHTSVEAGRIRRGLSELIGFIGLYLAAEVAPLPPGVDKVLSGTAFVVCAFVTSRVVISAIALLVSSSMTRVGAGERERLEREYVPLLRKLTTLAVVLVLVIVVAKHFGQDVTSLVAALGVGSLAIGLAAQQTLGNMIAGFTLLFDRPFRVGDRIQLATGEAGEVLEIGVRSTRIVLATRNLLIVPNAELVNSRVVNFHFPTPAARGEVRLTVAYGGDIERASRLLAELAAADERVAKAPVPAARVVSLGNAGVDLLLGFEVSLHTEVAAVEDQLRRKILTSFAAEKIDLPYPRTDVFLLNSERRES